MSAHDAITYRWDDLPVDRPMPLIDRRRIMGDRMMISHVTLHEGFVVPTHVHHNEQFAVILSGRIRFTIGDASTGGTHERTLTGGEVLHLPSNVPHGAEALETTVVLDLFSPPDEKTGVDTSASS
ncbi:MAG: cupin domain-containing protein [Phycisphaerales bacterium]|nr:cupin domain-containing protein [Phycisphaerales bacterium]